LAPKVEVIMAKFIFTGKLESDVIEDYEIADSVLLGKSEEERREVIERHLFHWLVDVASSEIVGGWEEE
jgi:hypothetical protein